MARSKQFSKWCETVKPGDIVGASNPRSQKGHLLRWRDIKKPPYSRDGKTDYTMGSGRTLCEEVKGEGYWWNITQYGDPMVTDEDDCKRCYERWRAMGKPTIRNFVQEIAQGTVLDGEDLPFGWKPVSPSNDLQHTEWNYGKDHIKFQEVHVWKRGPRVIAIGKVVENTSDEKYPLLTARRWASEKKYDTRYRCSTMEQATKDAYEKMAKGGY